MRELNGHTKKAQNLIWNAEHFTGYELSDIYKSWSARKEQAYKRCREEYLHTEDRFGFHVGSANTHSFCASWFGTLHGEPILRYETKDNSYLVWLNR